MYRKKELLLVLLLAVLGLGIAGAGTGGRADAAYPTQTNATGKSAAQQPQYTDPYHHLSGVVVVPVSEMLGGQNTGGGGVGNWAGPLTPPIFGPNVDASLNNTAAQNETTISLNPDNDQIVIASANDYRAGLKPEVYRSSDGGTTWVNYQVGGTSSLYYGDPAMAFDHGNHAYFSYLGYTAVCTSNGGMYVSNSSDAGATFSAPVQLAANSVNGSTAIFHDKEYVAVDTNPASPYSGTVYVGWTKFIFQAGTGCGGADTQLGAPVVLSKSTDHGLSWSIPITASQPISNNNQATLPVIGRHGEVYLYYVGAATQHQLNYDSVLFSRSTDGGQTFPFFTRISDMVDLPSPLPPTSFRNNGFGAMAADQTLDGYLYAVWADYRTGDADILLSRSTDNGNTWSAPVRANDDPSGNGKDQFFPWIATSPDGYVHIAWLDRREDPTNHDYKEYYTYSTDHGATWQPNVAISTAASNPGSSNFIGDYTGLAAGSGVVMPNWTDIRSGGNQNAYVARGAYTPEATATATATTIVTATDTATSTSTSTSTAQPPTETPTTLATETATATACTLSFEDVPVGSTFYPYIECLACRGIINGYPCGGPGEPCNPTNDPYFRPGNNVTRGQFAKIAANSAGFNEPPGAQQYEDVPVGSTFFDYVWRLSDRGYVTGYPCGGAGEPCGPNNLPYFRPNANVTRGQLSKIDANAAGYNEPTGAQQYEDVLPGSTFYDFIWRLSDRGIINGYPCGGMGEPCGPNNLPYFRPSASATRGQASKIVANTFFPNCQTPSKANR